MSLRGVCRACPEERSDIGKAIPIFFLDCFVGALAPPRNDSKALIGLYQKNQIDEGCAFNTAFSKLTLSFPLNRSYPLHTLYIPDYKNFKRVYDKFILRLQIYPYFL